MNFSSKHTLLEKVYGAYAVVYHRTRATNLADKIYTSGFKPGDGSMYGKGFYATYDLDSQENSGMSETYGKVVVKFAVPTDNFLFFDYEPFIKSPLASKIKDYDKSNFVFKQLEYFGMEFNGYSDELDSQKEKLKEKLKGTFTSEAALHCYYSIKDFTRKCNGIVFNGRHDGRVLVCYRLTLIIPLSYRIDGEKKFTKITNKNLDYIKNVWSKKTGSVQQSPEEFGITKYKFNQDGTLDVFGDVNISKNNLLKLPFKFGKIVGNFDCSYNTLTSLENAPNIVKGNFDCSYNKLTSLENAPNIVKGGFVCYSNKLISLKGSPKEVEFFNCHGNNLTTLEGGPKKVNKDFQCSDNYLVSLKGSPKKVGGSFLCYSNLLTTLEGAPNEIEGSFNCKFNQLTSLKGAPKVVGLEFSCDENPLSSLEGIPKEMRYFYFTNQMNKTVKKFTKEDIEAVSNVKYISI